MESGREINAVIGVRRSGPLTYYVKRSATMRNYPGVWSLTSIQFDPMELRDHADLDAVLPYFRQMSRQRLGDVPIHVERHLTSGSSNVNPMGVMVHLHLYEIELTKEPVFDPAYYTEARWMSAQEYEEASSGLPCGLCLRLWSDFAWLSGITDRPFVPTLPIAA